MNLSSKLTRRAFRVKHSSLAYLVNLRIRSHPAYKAWPETLRHVVRQPEPPDRRVIGCLHFIHQRRSNVTQLFTGTREGGVVRHEGWDDHLGGVDPQSYFKFLQ